MLKLNPLKVIPALRNQFNLTEKQNKIYNKIIQGQSLIVLGQAGCGKSHLIKKCLADIEGTRVICPTGIAAINLIDSLDQSDGQSRVSTIHSFFNLPTNLDQLPIQSISDRVYHLKRNAKLIYENLKVNKSMIRNIRETKLLIIDEVGMVHPDTLDLIDHLMRVILRNNQVFGGVQTVLTGDLVQLAPVQKSQQYSPIVTQSSIGIRDKLLYGSLDEIKNLATYSKSSELISPMETTSQENDVQLFCFDALVWKKFENQIVWLDQNLRSNQLLFTQFLNYIRDATLQEIQTSKLFPVIDSIIRALHIPLYKRKYSKLFQLFEGQSIENLEELIPFVEPIQSYGHITEAFQFKSSLVMPQINNFKMTSSQHLVQHVYPLNSEVDRHNSKMLKHVLVCQPVIINSIDQILDQNGNLTTDPYIVQQASQLFNQFVLPSKLELGIGAQIVLTRNLNTKHGLVNGAVGKVLQIQPESIDVQFQHISNNKVYYNPVKLRKLKQQEYFAININGQLTTGQIVRTQYPIRLAYSSTIHKIQGKTLEQLHLSLRSTFEYGQTYCGLSRCTSFNGLALSGYSDVIGRTSTIVRDKIWQKISHPRVKEYMQRIKN